jgi:hypothetical protein
MVQTAIEMPSGGVFAFGRVEGKEAYIAEVPYSCSGKMSMAEA